MLRLPNSLLFPRLAPQGKISFKQSGGEIQLYKLDWSYSENLKKEKWLEQQPCSPAVFKETFPESLKPWVDDLQFAISKDFLEEIRHCSYKAAEEWERRTYNKIGIRTVEEGAPFSLPTLSYVLKAFHLLADCLYDPETNFYSRTDAKLLIPYAHAYRFWCYQVKTESLEYYASLKDLSMVLDHLPEDSEAVKFGKNLLNTLREHTKSLISIKSEVVLSNPLLDFLQGKRQSLNASDQEINIPGVGVITLFSPKLKKLVTVSQYDLEAEISATSKQLQNLHDFLGSHQYFTFPIRYNVERKNGGTFIPEDIWCHHATLSSMSTMPPASLSFKVRTITLNRPKEDIVEEPITAKEGEIRKIDISKITKSRNEDLFEEEIEQAYKKVTENLTPNLIIEKGGKEEKKLLSSVISDLRLKETDPSQTPHFMGIDVGLKKDGTAIAICHVEKIGSKNFIELDYIEARYSTKEEKEFFQPEEIADWIASFTKKFFITKGIMDLYYGSVILPILHEKGHRQFQSIHINRKINAEIYTGLMSKIREESLRIPDMNNVGDKTELPLIKELLGLQNHDDMSDAFALAVSLASECLPETEFQISNDPSLYAQTEKIDITMPPGGITIKP